MSFQVVPRSNRQLITGESANQSTNLSAVRVKPAGRRDLICGSNNRVITGSNEAPLLGRWREIRGEKPAGLLRCRWYRANAGRAPVGSNIEVFFFANAAFFLGRLLRRIVLILLRFVSRTRRLSNSGPDKVSSNQLVPSRPQERLR